VNLSRQKSAAAGPPVLALILAACGATPGGADAGPDAGGGGDGGPDQPGAFALTTRSASVVRAGRTTPVVAHLPVGAGRAPLVIVLPGFQLRTAWYLATVEHLASQGMVVVRAEPPSTFDSADHAAMAADTSAVLDWALDGGPLEGAVDPERVGVLGHSLGGKLAVMAAFADPRVRAVFGIDPVDASLPDVVPSQVTPLTIPLGFAGETIDADSSTSTACAPADGNYVTFYDAATQAPWAAEWTFAGVNHTDFVDDCGGSIFCALCNPVTGDKPLARARLHTLEAAFFRLHLGGEAAMEAYLTGASLPSAVGVRHR
jgi:dienelactone hydrolase